MSIVLFSREVADVRSDIRLIHQNRGSSVLVEAFLEKAYDVVRRDVFTQSREARNQIPVFSSVIDLSERHHDAETRSDEISCALLCICQLAHFLGFFEQHPDQYPIAGRHNLIVGVGLGQLSAAAVSCSRTTTDLIGPAVQAVHLAFQVGAVVARFSSSSQVKNDAEEHWSMTVAGTADEIEREVQVLQDQMKIPRSARAYIDIVNQKSCNVSGPPARLRQLKEQSPLFDDAIPQNLPIAGFWHAPHVYGREQVSEVLGTQTSLLDEIGQPCRAILSTSTGELIQGSSGRLLFTEAVDNILRRPVRWDHLQHSIVEHINSESASGTLELFEIGSGHNLLYSILDRETRNAVEGRDLSLWCSTDKDNEPQAPVKSPNIAIVGMSGRFPGATDHETLWKLLEQGRDMHRTVPKDRFDVETHVDPSGKKVNTSHTPYGCFIEEPGLFDPRFFNMSPREAAETDPMHRLALITAYEALEQSGFVLNATASTQQDRVGTFYGQTSDDWREVNAAQKIATYFIPGGVRAFAPGRINYYFGFRGPSFSIDTACSSSLAAIQIACTSLSVGECDTAVAGGVNILTAPDIFAGLSRGQFLSPTGPCKTWDSEADGYCRADGVGSIILKREEDAISDGDNILGTILATATNHSADAISITHPHAGNQSYLYEKVLHTAGIDPLDISYVEMHGTGTQAGDNCEVRSVTDVFAPDARDHARARGRDQALYIGAVKSNVGHGEAAAGITALIKVLLMLQKNSIPPHVGIKNNLNPAFPDLDSRNVRIPFHKTPWPRINGKPRIAFLNNFSAAGGNTAMILQDSTQRTLPLQPDPRSMLPLVVSAKSITSLQSNIQQLISYTQGASETSLASLSYTLTARRMHHNYRVGVTASDLKSLRTSLSKEAAKGNFTPIPSKAPAVAFVFTGQGAFYSGLGRELFETSQVFRSEIIHLNDLAMIQDFPSLLPAIQGSINQEPQLSTLVTHLALVSVQISLIKLWQSWGIMPAVVIGHSLGEYAALYAAGVLSEHDVLHLVGCRAKLLQEKCTAGTHCMLAVKASVAKIRLATKGMPFEIACINAPSDTVLSGKVEEIDIISRSLKQAGHKCLVMDIPYAFHSAQIDLILQDFKSDAGGATFSQPRIPVISTLLGDVINTEGVFNADYLCRQARESVDFAKAVRSATDSGILNPKTVFVEIGPHPICTNMVEASVEGNPIAVASLHKTQTPWVTLSKSLCSLHCMGLGIDWQEFHRDFTACHELLNLPVYKFDNKNYWINYVNDWCLHKTEPRTIKLEEPVTETPKLSTSSVHRIVAQELDGDVGKVVVQSDLSEPALQAAILGHLVNGAGLCPSSIYADIALTLGDYISKWLRPSETNTNMNCSEMEVMKPLIVKNASVESQILQVTITANLSKDKAYIQYATVDTQGTEIAIHATCTIVYEDEAMWSADWIPQTYLINGRIETLTHRIASNKADRISRGLAYKLFSALVQYDKKYQGMDEVILDSENFEATSRVRFQTEDKDGTFFFSPFWIDSLAHLSGFILNGSDAVDSKNFVYISHGWKSLRVNRPLNRTTAYASYVKMQASPNNVMTGDVYIFEEEKIIGVVGGLKFQRIPRAMLNTILPPISVKPSQAKRPEQVLKPSSNTGKAAKESQKKSARDLLPRKRERSVPILNSRSPVVSSSAVGVVAQVMDIISQESEVPLSELIDDCRFPDLGVDSLLSLQICGKIRESLEIEIQSSVFVECETVGMLRSYLRKFESASGSSLTTPTSSLSDEDDDHGSDDSASSAASTSSERSKNSAMNDIDEDDSKKNTMMLFRTTIAEQMGIALEEVVGSNDLLSLGIDSLMSICILGILREKTNFDLPSSLFIDHPSIDAVEGFLGLKGSKATDIAKSSKPQKYSLDATMASAVVTSSPSPKAISILMQGKSKTATKTLFLFPDGSGAATSYASIPAIDPHVAVYGLNSPFLDNPSDFAKGIVGVASIYLAEVRRRQPHGPYHLGGWSAGGIVAYEVVLQLLADGERVESLIFLDSPCPINLEPLPSRLHKFLADVGLIGAEGMELPPWLLPHFEATIKALKDYDPISIEDKLLAPRTLAIWARRGVCGQPGDSQPESWDDDPKSMRWLLEDRTDFGPNGWDALLGKDSMKTESVDANHFSLMKDMEHLGSLASFIRDFLSTS